MSKSTLTLATLCLAIVAPCSAANLDVQLFPLSGEVRFRNPGATPVALAFYSIDSNSGALNGANGVWTSIEDSYDRSGNGFIDPSLSPDGEWVELSALSTQLAEGALDVDGGRLPAFRSVSLGQIWNPALGSLPASAFDVRQPDESLISITTQFAVAGDYNSNGTVDQPDFLTWRQNFGSTMSLNADGNLNGIVDAADFVIWRDNFGLTLPGTSSLLQGSGSGLLLTLGATVPEPAAAILFVSAAGAMLTARGRAPRAGRRATNRSSPRR